jgi:cysteine desulfurase / selenocysteine lyase
MTTSEDVATGSTAPISSTQLAQLANQIYRSVGTSPSESAPSESASAARSASTGLPRGAEVPNTATSATAAPGGLTSTKPVSSTPISSAPAAPGLPTANGVNEPTSATILAGLPGADTPPYTVPVAARGSAPSSSAAQAPAGFGAPLPSLSGPATYLTPTPQVPASPGFGGPGFGAGPEVAALEAEQPRGWQPGELPAVSELPLNLGPWAPASQTVPSLIGSNSVSRGVSKDDQRGLLTQRSLGGLGPDATSPIPGGGVTKLAAGPSGEFDVTSIRADFPILSEQVNHHRLIWFDNAATTQKPQVVIDRLAHFYAHENSNIHRAAHALAARATDAYEDARDTIRDYLGAARSEEIVFVRGATEAINLVAQSWGRQNLGPGDEILITNLEHHANIVPWQIVARTTGAVIKVAPVDDAGNLLLNEFTELLGPRTKLVTATHVANAIGTVTPVTEIVELAHRVGARVLIDGAQSVPHLPVNLSSLGADFFVFSGHKVFGPTGIGVVYLAERIWDETPPWQGGGNMIADVTVERTVYQGPPNKYEAGTGNIADAVGLAAALRYVRQIGIDKISAYEHALLDYATTGLAAIDGVRVIGTADHKASVLSFVLAGHDPENVGAALNQRGIAVRAGHHCAQPILRRLGVEKTVRPSFAFYNTREEIDSFLRTVQDLSERGAT